MAKFEVLVQKIFIQEHPNADALELGNIGDPNGWQVVVKKDLFKTGDLVAYIGESAVVPEWVLKKYGFWNEEKNKGLLAGSKGDRVKMVKLRGENSLGICIPVIKGPNGNIVGISDGIVVVDEGQDVSEWLGVTKYEPPIPSQLSGEVFYAGTTVGVNYDIEDFKKFPTVLQEGEEVQMTVKIHGTNIQIVWLHPDISDSIKAQVNIEEWIKVWDVDYFLGYCAVASKGLGAQGMFFKDNEANANNVYLRAAKPHLVSIALASRSANNRVTVVVGEVFGKNIQPGYDYGQSEISLRAFDVYVGFRGQGRYYDDLVLDSFCAVSKVPRVPIVYRGPFSFEIMNKLANDSETEFDCKHIREGVIVKPVEERYHPTLGRVALKHRSDAYMNRATGEEFN